MYDLERVWIGMGYSPTEFMYASLRQVYAVMGVVRDRAKREWEHTLTIYAAVRNTTAKKRSDLIDPYKMLDKMFPKSALVVKEKSTQSLMDKFRMLQVQTGGRDNRNELR